MSTEKYPTIGKGLIVPFALITICFALWGAANNITDFMVPVFKQVKDMTNLQASIIQTAFYGAYFCAPIPAAFIIKKFGYKSGTVAGLLLYALGTFLCYPASQADSFSFFLTAFYVFAFGCAMLETAVAPFILAMGPKETATQRINLAQSFNPMGSLIGIAVGKFVILKHLTSPEKMATLDAAEKTTAQSHDLSLVVTGYTAIGIVALIVAVFIFLRKFPEIKTESIHSSTGDCIKKLIKNKNYVFSVIAQFFYVGAQIGIWTNLVPFVLSFGVAKDSNEASTFMIYSLIAFTITRIIYTSLMKKFDPARILTVAMALTITALLVSINSTGMLAAVSLVAVSAFMSLAFPTIYGLGLTGLSGDEQKIGGSGIIMAIVGGAILVPLQGFMSDGKLPEGEFILNVILRNVFQPIKSIFDSANFDYSVANSYCLPLFCFVIVALYGFVAHKKEQDAGILHEDEENEDTSDAVEVNV